MNKLGPLVFAAQFAPRLFQVRRRTWIAVGVGLLVLFGLMVWAGLALLGWLFGQAQTWMGDAPEAVRGAVNQAEQAVPGAREKIGEWVPALKPAQPQRDVSGSDLGPVPRYPGLARTLWQRDGQQVRIEYQGSVDYAKVLDHYTKGFAAQGYTQNVQSATPTAETHEYIKGSERVVLTIAELPQGRVSARLEMTTTNTNPDAT